MEQKIRNYEAQNKTENKVLDTLLTMKNLYCMKNDISMTCVVDGILFDFMDVMDICSIFGNALDNAIECEEKIADKEKRMIHVSAFSKMNFLRLKLLTIAVPCYNSQEYMRKCIDSLLEGGNMVEILIIDDGSSDDTGRIADQYEAAYPDIVRTIHQKNGGHGEAVNTGIRYATMNQR